VSDCVVPAHADRPCGAADPQSPAAAAGMRKGDRLVSFDGHHVGSWDQLTGYIRGAGGRSVPVVVQRGRQRLTLQTKVLSTQRPAVDEPRRLETVGFLGVTPKVSRVREGPVVVA